MDISQTHSSDGHSRSATIPPRHLMVITLSMGLASLLCLPFAHVFWNVSAIRGACGGIGCFLAVMGSGIGIWAAIRLISFRLVAATLPAIASLVLWGWFAYVKLLR